MKESFDLIVEFIKLPSAMALLAVIACFGRAKIREYDKHLESCNEVPKALLVEKLDALTKSVDGLRMDITEVKADLKDQIESVSNSYQDFRNMVTNHFLSNKDKRHA